MTKCTIVAIAKNEKRYLPEWISYHLAIGADRILVYDNDSTDGTSIVLEHLQAMFPVERVEWPSIPRHSPQRTAYKDALARIDPSDFVLFIDIDEFIVPWGYDDLREFTRKIPESASAVVLNWRSFGSSDVSNDSYESVIKTFIKCAKVGAANNKHVKTIARCADVEEPYIHHVKLRRGEIVASDFTAVEFESDGKTRVPIYNGIQINHYQVKTFAEFAARMARGNANFPPGHPAHEREATFERFKTLDRNEQVDTKIEKFFPAFDEWFQRTRAALVSKLQDDAHI